LLLVAIDVRNLVKPEDLQMSMLHYLKNLQPIMSGFDQLPYDISSGFTPRISIAGGEGQDV
jgi:hypothetical protein